MRFNPCAVVPVYRHENTVRDVVRKLIDLKLPVIVIDDGNPPEAFHVLKKVAEEFLGVIVISHQVNMGKGGAVCSGLREAFRLGFTHALQVDAGGQHDASAIPFLLKASRKHFKNLVGGFPVYDMSVPRSREIGRKITNFWVHVETLSSGIPDAMCGLRIYPLARTVPVLEKIRTFRMGFDIEILVRLSWENVGMNFYPVKVFYPQNGISNFHMFRDNVEISKLHMRLVCGMLLRLPRILFGKNRNG